MIPAEKAKNKLQHSVPLSSLALKEIKKLEPGRWLIPSWYTDGHMSVAGLSNALAVNQKHFGLPRFTPHDLRRTAATHMTKTCGVTRFIVGQVLNHVEKGVTAIYDRHRYDPEKKSALDKWDRELQRILGVPQKARLVEMAGGDAVGLVRETRRGVSRFHDERALGVGVESNLGDHRELWPRLWSAASHAGFSEEEFWRLTPSKLFAVLELAKALELLHGKVTPLTVRERRTAWLDEKLHDANTSLSKLGRPCYRAIMTYRSGKTTKRTLQVRRELSSAFNCPLREVPL